MAEEHGTWVNRDDRLQRYEQARGAPGMARPAWWVAGEVLLGRGPNDDAPASADEAFELLGRYYPAFAGISYRDIGFSGRALAGAAQGVR